VLDSWYSKWSDHIKNHSHGALMDYFGRFTRFCITSYAIKFLRRPRQGLTSLQQDQVRRCVACAIDVLDWPLSLNPIQKDRLRYVPDSSCVMVSFCGLFVLSACQTFTSCVSNIDENLEYVSEAAQLMLDLSINAEHKPHIQGTYILKRVDEVRKAVEHSKVVDVAESLTESRPVTADGSSGLTLGSPDLSLNDNAFFDMEPIWDFSMLFPNTMFPTA